MREVNAEHSHWCLVTGHCLLLVHIQILHLFVVSNQYYQKGIYRVTSTLDGNTYSVDMQPHGRRKMHGVITGTETHADILIDPKERPGVSEVFSTVCVRLFQN